MITPFRIDVPQADLADLRARLRRTRWPDAETATGHEQGVPLAYLRDLCAYWAERYDWRATERRLNALPQFRTEIDGVGIHFVHVRSPHPGALALVLTHGWPGSFLEFEKAIPLLTDPADPADAFHVVIPSLPGYGFSDRPRETGWGVQRIAAAWAQLMARLGYERYGAMGSDWGTSVTTSLGQQDAAHLAGIHLMPPLAAPDPATFDDLTEAESRALADLRHAEAHESGYNEQMTTKPQTVGYALNDSPAGLAGWIVEKFRSWMDCGGDPETVLTRDEMLDDITLYWLTGTATSSARLYWESFRQVSEWFSSSVVDTVDVPAGCSVFPREIPRPSRRWAGRRYTDIRHWGEPERGGHFAAFEQPEIFTSEVRAFFRLVR
ncbi:epoxide hydrolase family protein [Kibdelosporangium phytohabitans]|uniref:Epoxide hydrolase n=1 Tax=Kibdelosporangium phytohabitans TaxID=860235 RepID=A0A0N7F3F1_9PSEU|nr:epoxide hydrolase family protein [Kibdelosporangium phytohabitans]ALG08455.1 epoxide hydrolase [Kibdelosporangium phytohabitans]MBE1470487.1 pimeloyl-ACP methyl ester carboxylesterase [Kibdelosporangium phytohabitans]